MQPDELTDLEYARRGRLPRPGRSLSSRGAIYHLSARTSSRAKGNSARASAAYIQREGEYGRMQDKAAELIYTESGHMPGWAEAAGTAYWEAADAHERANGRLCQRLEFALPLALTEEERRELAVGFARHLTDAERLPYTLAIHAGAGHNPHCHLMISERGNDGLERDEEQWFKRYNAAEPEQGGARKSTALRGRDWLAETRAAWAEQTNEALERAGHAVRIDHRSLEAQGIERVAGSHLGPAGAAMEARGVESERGAENRADRAGLQQEAAQHERTRPGAAREQEQEGAGEWIEEAEPQETAGRDQRPSQWAAVAARVGGWFFRKEAPEAAPDVGAVRMETEEERDMQSGESDSYSENKNQGEAVRSAPLPSVEEVARDEHVAQQVAAIEDPAKRAKAEKLLQTIREEAATREARKATREREPAQNQEQGRQRGRGRDEDFELEP